LATQRIDHIELTRSFHGSHSGSNQMPNVPETADLERHGGRTTEGIFARIA